MAQGAEPPPTTTNSLSLSNQQQLPPQLEQQMQARETRLVTLLHSIGHPSLDSLEDFIFLHGASKLVPLSSIPPTSVDSQLDSQSHLPLSPTKHHQRKQEILDLRQEISRLKAEVEYANLSHQREKNKREQVTRDLDRLLGVALESQQRGELAADEEQGGGGQQEEIHELYGQLQRAYDEIERLDLQEKELREKLEAREQELVEERKKGDEAEGKVSEVEEKMKEAAEERSKEAAKRVESEKELTELREKISVMTSAVEQGPPPIDHPVPNTTPQLPRPPSAPRSSPPAAVAPSPHAAVPSTSNPRAPSHPSSTTAPFNAPSSGAPKPSQPKPLARTQSSSTQLSLYASLLASYSSTLPSLTRNQTWYTTSWLPFASANSNHLSRLPSLPTPPAFVEQVEYPKTLEGREDGKQLYEELEAREREAQKAAKEWAGWKKFAGERVEEVRKLAEEVERRRREEEERGEKTSRPLKRKVRKVAGTGSQARATQRGGEGVETPSRIESRPAAPLVPSGLASTSAANFKLSAHPQPQPQPQPPKQHSTPAPNLALPTPKSISAPITNTTVTNPLPRPHPPPHLWTPPPQPQPVISASSPPPPQAQPTTTTTTTTTTTAAAPHPSPLNAAPLPASPPRPAPPPTIHTPQTLTRTPRKTKRRSDILHLSASGHRAPHLSTPGSEKGKGKGREGAQPRLLRETLRAAARERGVEEEKGMEKGTEKEQTGDLEEEEEEDGDQVMQDVFLAPPPPPAPSSAAVDSSQQQLQPPPLKQPESSWEPEPDTQSEHESELSPRKVVLPPEPEEQQEGTPRGRGARRTEILVPPSSTDESQSSQPLPQAQPKTAKSSPSLPRPPSAPSSRTSTSPPDPAPLAPSKHHSNRPPPPPPPSAPFGETQFLIAAAEAAEEEEDGDVEDEGRIREREREREGKRRKVLERRTPASESESEENVQEQEQEQGGGMPPSAQVGSRRRPHHHLPEGSPARRPSPSQPTISIKPEPLSPPALPPSPAPAPAPARQRIPILGGAFGSPPAPAADWKAIERGEREKKGKGRGKRGREEGDGSGKGKRRKIKVVEPEEEEDVKPLLSDEEGGDEVEEGNTTRLRALDDTNFSDLEHSPGGEEDPDGHHWMRRLHAKRKMEVDKLRKEKARKSAPSKPAIEINPARNGGKNYHFTEVVRNKEARKHMHAHTCEGCAGYYEEDERSNFNHAANCKGSGSNGSSSKSKSTSSKKSKNHFLDERHRQMEARLQKTSRHRAQHKPDPEPPDYWQMGFPNTQRVEEINRRAEKDREEKRLYMEAQAQTDGFYRYRKD